MKTSIIQLYSREIDRLTSEIEQYKDETSLWKIAENISNCAGNLCLHLVGNLNHFIGRHLGNTDYIRQRDLEFSTKDVPKETLLSEVANVKKVVITALTNFPEEKLQENYPIEKNGEILTNEFMLLHLLWHLSYHLGQINYHRRLLDI
ncbi:MAG: DinB family protein [Bacteroidota bacterium]